MKDKEEKIFNIGLEFDFSRMNDDEYIDAMADEYLKRHNKYMKSLEEVSAKTEQHNRNKQQRTDTETIKEENHKCCGDCENCTCHKDNTISNDNNDNTIQTLTGTTLNLDDIIYDDVLYGTLSKKLDLLKEMRDDIFKAVLDANSMFNLYDERTPVARRLIDSFILSQYKYLRGMLMLILNLSKENVSKEDEINIFAYVNKYNNIGNKQTFMNTCIDGMYICDKLIDHIYHLYSDSDLLEKNRQNDDIKDDCDNAEVSLDPGHSDDMIIKMYEAIINDTINRVKDPLIDELGGGFVYHGIVDDTSLVINRSTKYKNKLCRFVINNKKGE